MREGMVTGDGDSPLQEGSCSSAGVASPSQFLPGFLPSVVSCNTTLLDIFCLWMLLLRQTFKVGYSWHISALSSHSCVTGSYLHISDWQFDSPHPDNVHSYPLGCLPPSPSVGLTLRPFKSQSDRGVGAKKMWIEKGSLHNAAGRVSSARASSFVAAIAARCLPTVGYNCWHLCTKKRIHEARGGGKSFQGSLGNLQGKLCWCRYSAHSTTKRRVELAGY